MPSCSLLSSKFRLAMLILLENPLSNQLLLVTGLKVSLSSLAFHQALTSSKYIQLFSFTVVQSWSMGDSCPFYLAEYLLQDYRHTITSAARHSFDLGCLAVADHSSSIQPCSDRKAHSHFQSSWIEVIPDSDLLHCLELLLYWATT